MEENVLGYIYQYSEWAVGGSIETTSTNVKFYELDGLYYKLETSINILGEKDSLDLSRNVQSKNTQNLG